MKKINSILIFLMIFTLCSCSSRSIETISVQENNLSTAVSEENSAEDIDLSVLSENTLGQNLLSVMREVCKITVNSTNSGELVYESEDIALSQSFYDALQIVNEEYESLDIRPYDFEVVFDTALGKQKSYGIWVNFEKNNNVIVQHDGKFWDIPISDSNFIRTRLAGLA